MEIKNESCLYENLGHSLFVSAKAKSEGKGRMDMSNEYVKKNSPLSLVEDRINMLNRLVKKNDSSFMIKFHEFFPAFVAKLNRAAKPSLNSAEMEICAYAKLNFSTKEIALYRKHTVRSVENRKYRIRKKLKMNPTEDFILWMARIKLT